MGLPPAHTTAGQAPAPDPGAQQPSDSPVVPRPAPAPTETATVRQIVSKLDQMPRDQARWLAAFAYVLSRAAEGDLNISDGETKLMEQIVIEHGKIDEAQAIIVVEIAKTRAELFGATEDYLVTREFRKIATDDQCLDLLRCCYLVGAADGSITAEESGTLSSIANELGVDEAQIHALRAEFADKFSAIQEMRKAQGSGAGTASA
jgi:uncharacterized tellurite resistance protein B-like protein